MTAAEALARTLHATAPCPQRRYDEREAEEIIAGLATRGFGVAAPRQTGERE